MEMDENNILEMISNLKNENKIFWTLERRMKPYV